MGNPQKTSQEILGKGKLHRISWRHGCWWWPWWRQSDVLKMGWFVWIVRLKGRVMILLNCVKRTRCKTWGFVMTIAEKRRIWSDLKAQRQVKHRRRLDYWSSRILWMFIVKTRTRRFLYQQLCSPNPWFLPFVRSIFNADRTVIRKFLFQTGLLVHIRKSELIIFFLDLLLSFFRSFFFLLFFFLFISVTFSHFNQNLHPLSFTFTVLLTIIIIT